MRPKVVLDLAFLGHEARTQRGTERVVRQLFEGLLKSGQCDLSFVATSHLAGTFDFLQGRGLDPEELLHFSAGQLARSRMGRSLSRAVHAVLHWSSPPARIARYALSHLARLCTGDESNISPAWMAGAQIYHSPHTPFPGAVAENSRLRKFITCHDFIPLKFPQNSSPGARRFIDEVLACLQPQNFAFCVSEATRHDVLTFSKMPPERVFVTPLAANADIFYPVEDGGQLAAIRERYGIGSEPYFLMLSAHDPHKNFGHVVECFAALVETGALGECNLVVVGPNPGRDLTLQRVVARFPSVGKKIVVAGFVPDEDLAAIYSGSLAFLFPSLAEGFGIPPLEAMQCGVPVIASNTTSVPEVVGSAGMLLPPTDKDLWCDAMLRMSGDATLRSEFSGRSRARARLFSWERFIAETLRGYRASLEMGEA